MLPHLPLTRTPNLWTRSIKNGKKKLDGDIWAHLRRILNSSDATLEPIPIPLPKKPPHYLPQDVVTLQQTQNQFRHSAFIFSSISRLLRLKKEEEHFLCFGSESETTEESSPTIIPRNISYTYCSCDKWVDEEAPRTQRQHTITPHYLLLCTVCLHFIDKSVMLDLFLHKCDKCNDYWWCVYIRIWRGTICGEIRDSLLKIYMNHPCFIQTSDRECLKE